MKTLNKFICIFIIIVEILSFNVHVYANTKNISNIIIFAKFSDDNSDIYNAKGKLNNWEYIKQIYDKDLDPSDSSRDKSFKNYIYKISEGKINVKNYFPQESSAKDSVNTYRLSNDKSYYSNSSMIVSEIIKAINESKISLNIGNEKLDNKNTGIIDTLTIIVQGDSTEKCSAIYPHKANYAGNETIKSLKVRDYIILPSKAIVKDDASDTIIDRERGTVAHEFLHTLGMPDLYSNSGKNPVGSFCIMSKTGMKFRYPLSYLRAQQGWIDKNYITKSGTYTLNAVSSDGDKKIYIIKTPIKDSEYIVLEYRKKTDLYYDFYDFENGIPNSGLLVYRVNENIESKSNLSDENYIYVYRKDDGDNNIYDAILKPNTNSSYGNADLSINIKDDKNILYYSDGSNSGIKISEVKTTSDDKNEISFKIEFPDYSNSNLWENIGTLTSNGDSSPDSILYTDKINNTIYSVYTEGTYNSSSNKVIVKKLDGTNFVNVGNPINGMRNADIINFNGQLYLVCINQSNGNIVYYKFQNSDWKKEKEFSYGNVSDVNFVSDKNSLYVMYIEEYNGNQRLILKDVNTNNVIIEKTSNNFCNPSIYIENNKIYLVHGTFEGSNSKALIDSYDIKTKKWIEEEKFSKFTNVNIIKKYNNKLYALMGSSGNNLTMLTYDGKKWTKKEITSIKKFMSVSMDIINDEVYISYYDTEDNRAKIIKVSDNIELFNDTLGGEYSHLSVVTDSSNKYMYAIIQPNNNSKNIIVKRIETKIKGNSEEIKKFQDIMYQTHVQKIGWQNWVENGEMSGTEGKSLRLEGIRIKLENKEYEGNIEYQTHVQKIGWQEYVKNGELSGTSGKSLRLEAIKIKLTGEISNHYDVYYRVHIQNRGWLDWAKNDEPAGSSGYSYRLEGIQIMLVEKGGEAPGNTINTYIHKLIGYQTHIQNIGWQSYVHDGQLSGTSGRSLRLEGIKIKLEDKDYEGNIEYQTHVQKIGWQEYVKNGELSGTSGKSLRLEAIRIRLTGEISNHYDVYYRVHVQNLGWLDWAKNDEPAGTSGYSYRLEGIQIILVKKGNEAPGATTNCFKSR